MKSSRSLESILYPFVDFDSYVRALLEYEAMGLTDSKSLEHLHATFSDAKAMLSVSQSALIGLMSKHRAADFASAELADFTALASTVIASDSTRNELLRSFGLQVKEQKLASSEDTSRAAALLVLAFAFLSASETVSYSALNDTASASVPHSLLNTETYWKHNTTPEHRWRQLEWSKDMVFRLWLRPRAALKDERETLKAGHLFAALSRLARPLLR